MQGYKAILISLGTLSLCIGAVGVVVPGLPTTPFLLLTAGLYIRSSEKLYQKLISNRIFGSYIVSFYAQKGMTLRAKFSAISVMWLMILSSVIFFISNVPVKIVVVVVGIIGSIVMGFVVPTAVHSKTKKVGKPSGNEHSAV